MFGSLYVFLHCKGFNAIDQGERAGRKVGDVSTEAKGIRSKGAINLSHDLVRTASMRRSWDWGQRAGQWPREVAISIVLWEHA